MSNLFSNLKLQSPFWQGIGAIVSIFAITVSSFVAYDIYQRSNKVTDLTIESGYSFKPIEFSESPNRRITMNINGEEISNATIYYYTVTNTGNVAITPNDYVDPITVSIERPFKILQIEKESSNRKSIKTIWNKISDNTFQLKPLLLNPNDSFTTSVFISEKLEKESKKTNQSETEPEPTASPKTPELDNTIQISRSTIPSPSWNARIINISDIRFTSYRNSREARQAEARLLGIFYTSFSHSGWGVYRFAALVIILFIFGLFFGIQCGIFQKISFLYYILLSLLMGLSVVAGDNVASRIGGITEQPLISNLSLFLYPLLIVFFVSLSVRKSLQKKNTPTNNP